MKLDVIEIQIKDFKKSLNWYKQLFKPLHSEDGFVMFQTGAAILALCEGKKNQTTLYFRSKNLEKSYKQLKRKGIKTSKIEKVHWGKKFSFVDLEGNKHFVYQE